MYNYSDNSEQKITQKREELRGVWLKLLTPPSSEDLKAPYGVPLQQNALPSSFPPIRSVGTVLVVLTVAICTKYHSSTG